MIQLSNDALKTAFLIFVTIAMLIGLWLNIDPYACPIPSALLAGPQAPQPWCFEFWLNRYQTLIGAAAALIAGILAWRGAMRQVAMAGDQIKLINKQFAVDKIDKINTKLVIVDGICNYLAKFQTISDRLTNVVAEISAGAVEVCRYLERGEAPGPYINTVLEPLARELMEGKSHLDAYVNQIRKTSSNPYLPEDIKLALRQFVPEAQDQTRRFDSYYHMLRTDIAASSAKDALGVEYARIAETGKNLPSRVEYGDREAFVRTTAERNRLRALRDASETDAEL